MSTSDVVYLILDSLRFRGKVTKHIYENDAVLFHIINASFQMGTGSEHMLNIELIDRS